MDLAMRMLEHNVWFTGQLIDRAAALPDPALDRVIELSVPGVDDDPTLRSLLARLVIQLEMWDAHLAERPWTWPDDTPSIDGLRIRLDAAAAGFLEQMAAAFDDGRLGDRVHCEGDTVEDYTYAGVAAHVLTYSAHRRILAAGALEDAGVTDLDEDPIRWVGSPH